MYRQSETRHRAINILRSLFVARTLSEEARSPGRSSNVENAPRRRPITGEPTTPTFHIRRAILRMPPSPASQQPAARADPAECSHYVVISRDGRKLVTRVRALCCHSNTTHNTTDCKSAQQCTTSGHPLPLPQVTSGSVQ